MTRTVRLAAAVLMVMLIATPTATAAPCGERDPQTGQVAKGALEFTIGPSRPSIPFGRDTKSQDLNLIFEVTGCRLSRGAVTFKHIEIVPLPDGTDQIEKSFMSQPEVRIRADEVSVRARVEPTAFDPGSYGGLLEIAAPRYLGISRTPISLSRSEDEEAVPFLYGAAGGLGAFVLWGLLKKAANKRLRLDRGWAVVVAIAAILVGGINAVLSARDQDVWERSANGAAAAASGFTGGTTGAMAGLLGAVWLQPRTRRRRKTSPATPPQGERSKDPSTGDGETPASEQPDHGG